MSSLEVGSVFVRLGFKHDEQGLRDFDRNVVRAKKIGDIKTTLGGDFDDRQFKVYERQLERTRKRASQRDAFKAHLGGEYDATAFRAYQRELDRAERSTRSYERTNDDLVRGSGRLRTTFGSLFIGGAGVAAGATAFYALGRAAQATLGAFRESERVGRQTTAVLKSTGGQAGVTAKHIGDLAVRTSELTGVDDELIAQGENVLLTFTNVRNEVGKGNDVFDQATGLALDMSKALRTDLQGSVIQVGKALQDPVKGVTALHRIGVDFTKQQREQIKALVDSGNKLGAQKIILGELRKEFGGTAAATATNSDRLRNSIGNVAESIGGRLAPAVDKGSGVLNSLIVQMRDGTGKGGRLAAGLRRVSSVVGDVFSRAFRGASVLLKDNQGRLADLGETVGSVAGSVGRALGAIARAFAGTFGSGSGTGRDLRSIAGNVLDLLATVTRVAAAIIAAVTRVAAAIINRSLPGIVTAFRGLAQVIRGIIRIISGVLSGDFAKAWDGVEDIFDGGIKLITGSLRAGTAPLRAAAAAIGRAIGGAFSGAWRGIVSTAETFVNRIIDVINIIPGVEIKHVGRQGRNDTAKSGAGAAGDGGATRGPARRRVQPLYEGGKVTAPIAIMGEEAPEHPEWVIPTNPAYRNRAVGLWMMAAREIGIPGFARGGRYSQRDMEALWARHGGGDVKIAGAVGMAESGGDPDAGHQHPYHGLWQVGPGGSFDPDENAKQAIAKWRAGGRDVDQRWKPWEAYTGPDGVGSDGPWRKFIGNSSGAGGGIVGKALGAAGRGVREVIETAQHLAQRVIGKLPDAPGGILAGAFERVRGKAIDYIKDKAHDVLGAITGGGGAGGGESSSTGLVARVRRAIDWARGHGWGGGINSGFRSRAEQEQLYARYLAGGTLAAKPGSSSHEKGQAVDVSDPEGFARAMAGAPGNARLARLVPGEPWHFSVTGHRRGGRLGDIGPIGGQPLAGGTLAYRTGGRHSAKRRIPTRPARKGKILSAKDNRGITRSVARGETGIRGFEDDIQSLEREYGQDDREYGLSDEVLLIEHDDGSATVNDAAVTARVGELDKLIAKRTEIRQRIEAYRTAIRRLRAALAAAIKKLQAALKAATGKARTKERGGYREQIATYTARREELRATLADLGLDLEDQRIDLKELANERAEVAGTTPTAAPATPPEPPAAPDAPDAPEAPAPAPPSPADIAAAAIADVGNYLTAQQQSLSSYASNFITPFQAARPGGVFSGSPDQLAALAGARYLGAGGDSALGGEPGRVVNITNNYHQIPDNTQTWSSQMRFQIEAAVG